MSNKANEHENNLNVPPVVFLNETNWETSSIGDADDLLDDQ